MVAYTKGDLENQLVKYEKKLGLNFDKLTYREAITIIQSSCPKLHSTEELRKLALKNLKTIEKEFGFKALRLFMYDTCKGALLQSFTGKDILQLKYEKLIKDIKKYHGKLINELHLQLDFFVYFKVLEEEYQNNYGFIQQYNNKLYAILKTLNITNYAPELINVLQEELKWQLEFAGDKYYINQDLKDREVLDMLFEHIAEEFFDEEIVHDVELFYDYDGYGNEYFLPDYQKSWIDEDGTRHFRSWEKESSINDYEKRGLPKTINKWSMYQIC